MAGTTDLLQKASELLQPFAGIYGAIKIADYEADKFKYQYQAEALQAQLLTPEYEAQDGRESLYMGAGPTVPFNTSSMLWLGLGGLAVFLLVKNKG